MWYFLINRTILFRETSFQQVLLSSLVPKENIPQAILYTLEGVSENVFQNIFVYNIFSIYQFFYI